ncbi:unnamed protein product [Rhizoctonia solani]|uniref:Uncharacterized protein n=1 Tax=Rhizoctonia solani TaxID=456999 RepID=A0A8H3ALY4_9AGAM|nr:unnamed protein product [Rhizoctonia solani]
MIGYVSARINPQSTSTSFAPNTFVSGGVVEITVGSSLYGFNLQCDSRIRSPLYVRMFYFDATDFSMNDMFGHNAATGEYIPDILPGGQLLIGDGIDGGAPIRFNLSSGQEVELGYMKVFWSTQPLELDHLKQKSAFTMRSGDMRGAEVVRDVAADKWGTACLALILRKPV